MSSQQWQLRPLASLKVVPLFDAAQAGDIVGSHRRSAESIEAEKPEDDRTIAIVAVRLTESGAIDVYGWGQTDRFHALGMLVAGQHFIEGL